MEDLVEQLDGLAAFGFDRSNSTERAKADLVKKASDEIVRLEERIEQLEQKAK